MNFIKTKLLKTTHKNINQRLKFNKRQYSNSENNPNQDITPYIWIFIFTTYLITNNRKKNNK